MTWRILCWFGLHSFAPGNWATFEDDESGRPMFLTWCRRCAIVEGSTLTDAQRGRVDRIVAADSEERTD